MDGRKIAARIPVGPTHFLFSKVIIPAVKSTQLPSECVPGGFLPIYKRVVLCLYTMIRRNIIIIIILGISFMQVIYTYIPETNHVPREHCVATILM